MATSPLDPANVSVRADRSLGRGHGTRELGPSDSSDSGSDLVGTRDALGGDELDSDSDADVRPDHVEKVDAGDVEKTREED